MRRSKFTAALCLCLIILAACPVSAQSGQSVNKKYHYNLYWSGIHAGEAVMEYLDTPEGFMIKIQAKSSRFISYFYKVDDRSESILYPDGYPKYSTVNISEGRHRKHKVMSFGQISKKGRQKVLFHDVLNKEKKEFDLERPAYDPLSGYYAMTKTPMEVGRTEYINVFDSKKMFDAEINVLRKEKVLVPAGEFNTIVVNPLLKTEGIFLRRGNMYIWLTDDDRKLPVMFKSEVKIGSFIAKLVEEH